MTVQELFDRVVAEWPSRVNISDGYLVTDIGFMFPTLSSVWDNVEDRWKDNGDEWMNVGIWSLFQAAHRAARNTQSNNRKIIDISKLKISDFEYYLRLNLDQAEYDEYRALLK